MREFYRRLNMDPNFLMSRDYRGRLSRPWPEHGNWRTILPSSPASTS